MTNKKIMPDNEQPEQKKNKKEPKPFDAYRIIKLIIKVVLLIFFIVLAVRLTF